MEQSCIKCGIKDVYCKGMCKTCYFRNYQLINKDTIKHRRQLYYIKNRNKIKETVKEWCIKNPDKHSENQNNYKKRVGVIPMSKNKDCTLFLGVHVAEQVLSKVFNNVEKQPFGNSGFDFICGRGYKIDVKSACLNHRNDGASRWPFKIKNNKIADYFLCLAFDNRINLNPMHIWLIPGKDVNSVTGISVSTTTFSKWNQYELNIDKTVKCCDAMKSIQKKNYAKILNIEDSQ